MNDDIISCEEFDNLIDLSFFDELNADESRKLLEHRATCPVHSTSAIEASLGLLEGAFRDGSPAHGVPSAVETVSRLLAQVEAEESKHRCGVDSGKGTERRIELKSPRATVPSSMLGETRSLRGRLLQLRWSLAAGFLILASFVACSVRTSAYERNLTALLAGQPVALNAFDGLRWFPSFTLSQRLDELKEALAAMAAGKDSPLARTLRLLESGQTVEALLSIEEALEPEGGGSNTCSMIRGWIDTSTYDVRGDLDLDGDVDSTDKTVALTSETARLGAFPLLARALRMQAGLADGPGNPNEDLRSFALLVAARLFREHPDTTPDAVRASSEFRAGLVSLLGELPGKRRSLDRLHALTALAGCGTPRELATLYAIATDTELSGEQQRMAVRASESILRRSISCELVAEVDFPSTQRFIATVFPRTDPEKWPGAESDIADVSRAAAIVARKGKQGDQYRAFVATLQRNRLTGIGEAYLFASAQMPEAADLIRDRSPDLLRREAWTEELGRLCGLHGDELLTAEMRKLVTASREQLLDAFQKGLESAKRELDGVREELNHPFDKATSDLKVSYGGQEIEPNPKDGHEAIQWDQQLNASALAKWFFVGTSEYDVRASGRAILSDEAHLGVAAVQVSTDSSDSPDESRAKLAAPGRSALTLKFRVQQQAPLDVIVEQIKRADQLWPFDGTPRISVAVDDEMLTSDTAIMAETWHAQSFRINIQQVEPGVHTLTIRLTSRATAACSIKSVRIVELE